MKSNSSSSEGVSRRKCDGGSAPTLLATPKSLDRLGGSVVGSLLSRITNPERETRPLLAIPFCTYIPGTQRLPFSIWTVKPSSQHQSEGAALSGVFEIAAKKGVVTSFAPNYEYERDVTWHVTNNKNKLKSVQLQAY